MEGVRCISSSIVQAATQKAENQRIELNPWDLGFLLLDPGQRGLLFPKPRSDDQNSFSIQHLRTSLSQTLDHFPPLAGRLATAKHEGEKDETVSFFIDCNNAGALFVHAQAHGVTISDILKPVYVPSIVHSFFPLNGTNNSDGISNPLLGVQITELVDGVFIGCTINHSVVDGSSFWHFFNSWSEISRGASTHLSKPPIFQYLRNINYPVRIPHSLMIKQDHEGLNSIIPFKERVFHFSKQSIAKLKAKANLDVGTNSISSLQALLSQLWRSAIRSKKLDPNEEVFYFVAIGARSRLRELPENYFGNAVTNGIIAMKARELEQKCVGEIASEISRVIATQTGEEELKKDIETWVASPKVVTLDEVARMSNIMMASSSPRFDMYGNDFGWGRPIAVRSGSGNKFEGKLFLSCGADEGSIDVEACLSPETLTAMENDREFMDSVTTL